MKFRRIIRISKHVSPTSHHCLLCKSKLTPKSFSRNPKHHFPWGINYFCDCKKSGLWTNSIRGEKEFMEIIFGDRLPKNSSAEDGFCNDLYCPFCFKLVGCLKTGLMLNAQDNPIVYINDKYHLLNDLDEYIKEYDSGNSITMNLVGEEVNKNSIAQSIDLYGCRSLDHNGNIGGGRGNEYGEAEYIPIYNWIKQNKHLVPNEMIQELSS